MGAAPVAVGDVSLGDFTMRTCKTTRAAAAALASLSAGAASAGNLLTNGDFEAPYTQYGLPPGWTDSTIGALGPAPFDAPDLFVVKGSDYIPCCGVTGGTASMDNHFATFGAGDSPNAGGLLAQHFASKAGRTYAVTFQLAALGSVADAQSMNVAITDLDHSTTDASHDYRVLVNNDLDTTFTGYGFTFKATGSNTEIGFADTSSLTDSIDAEVDNVLIAAVPEPASWAMLIVGFAALGAVIRRRAATA